MRTFAQLLRLHREKAGLKQSDLALKVGVTGPYISLLESGKRPPPADEVTRLIEKALHLPAKTLLRVAHLARTPEDVLVAFETPGLRRIPLINKVSAGYPADFTDLDYPAGAADGYVVVPDLTDPNAFAIVVCGDSMAPRFEEGDILIISPAAPVKGGDFCFVRIDSHGEVTSTFKQVFFDDERTVRLASLNSRYDPRTYPREEITGLFRASRRLEVL